MAKKAKKKVASRKAVTKRKQTAAKKSSKPAAKRSAVKKKTVKKISRAPAKQAKIAKPGMMGDGTEEQNLNQRGNPGARITKDEVDAAFKKPE